MNSESVIMIGLQNHQQLADRPRLVSQKTREKSVKKHPLFEPQSGELGVLAFCT